MQNLQVVPVQSKAIQTIIWDHSNNQLLIKFTDSPLFAYPNAPKSLFEAFIKSPSKGKFYHEQIKNKYEPVRLDN